MIRGVGARSRSTVLLALVLLVLAALGAARFLPGLQRPDHGVVDLEPGLLSAHKPVRGVITLGQGLTVSMYSDGVRVQRQTATLFQTVRIAAPFSAAFGHVTRTRDGWQEHITGTVDHLRFTSVDFGRDGAVFHGVAFDDTHSLPATLAARRVGDKVQLTFTIEGADMLVLHTWRHPGTRGLTPRLPAVNLAGNTWWLKPATGPVEPAFATGLGSIAAIDSPAPTAIDLRHAGRGEIHVWSSTFRLTVL